MTTLPIDEVKGIEELWRAGRMTASVALSRLQKLNVGNCVPDVVRAMGDIRQADRLGKSPSAVRQGGRIVENIAWPATSTPSQSAPDEHLAGLRQRYKAALRDDPKMSLTFEQFCECEHKTNVATLPLLRQKVKALEQRNEIEQIRRTVQAEVQSADEPTGACVIDGKCANNYTEADCRKENGQWHEGKQCIEVQNPDGPQAPGASRR